jgi:hypothetical protein
VAKKLEESLKSSAIEFDIEKKVITTIEDESCELNESLIKQNGVKNTYEKDNDKLK